MCIYLMHLYTHNNPSPPHTHTVVCISKVWAYTLCRCRVRSDGCSGMNANSTLQLTQQLTQHCAGCIHMEKRKKCDYVC